MAKAKFHKSQRVFVKPVGTWAHVERVVPKWIRGCDEPIKVVYDCGMGREFSQEELEEETSALQRTALGPDDIEWRIIRGQNRWKSAEQCGHHPFPGTHPVLITTERDWGGWRVPGAEYDLDPFKIEQQVQLMVRAPMFFTLLRQLVDHTDQEPENISHGLSEIAMVTRRLLTEVQN